MAASVRDWDLGKDDEELHSTWTISTAISVLDLKVILEILFALWVRRQHF